MIINHHSLSLNRSNRISDTQNQLNEVVGIMKNNVERVLERENKLNDLDDRATGEFRLLFVERLKHTHTLVEVTFEISAR